MRNVSFQTAGKPLLDCVKRNLIRVFPARLGTMIYMAGFHQCILNSVAFSTDPVFCLGTHISISEPFIVYDRHSIVIAAIWFLGQNIV